MSEQVKEILPKAERESLGRMLLDLMYECPNVPNSIKDKEQIYYNSTSDGKGIFILTDGGRIKKKDIYGFFTATINMQIAYQAFPTDNDTTIAAQERLEKITEWFSDLDNLPTLAGDRKITKFDASGGYPSRDASNKDASVVFVSDVAMEYEVN